MADLTGLVRPDQHILPRPFGRDQEIIIIIIISDVFSTGNQQLPRQKNYVASKCDWLRLQANGCREALSGSEDGRPK